MKNLLLLGLTAMMSVGMMAQPPHHHDFERGHGPGHGPNHPHESHHVICATQEQLSMTLQVLEQQSFDDKRLEVAKLAVTLGHFCTDNLARIAQIFAFDDRRLEFLLYAHSYCEDPQNYPALRDVFKFQSNYDKLIDTLYPRRK